MPFNGSGVYQRVFNWVTDKNNSVNITASRMDIEDTGFATGLSTCILKDGTQIVTADIPFNGHKITGLANGALATDAINLGQAQGSVFNWVISSGTSDAITAAYSPAVTTLVDGMELDFRATASNTTTTPTFSPSGLTAATITQNGGAALFVGSIAGALFEGKLRYNLANTRWELMNPSVVQPPFLDTKALIKGASDATKLIRFEVDGNTTGTTRIYTASDKNGTLALLSDIPTFAPAYNWIAGCLITSLAGTHTTASATISAGQATDSTNAAYITCAGYSWAAANGNAINGTDAVSSTLANSTTYHISLCSGASGTGTFCSASLTPTFPSGYTSFSRRIGSFNTDSSGNPLTYTSRDIGGPIINWLVTQVRDINVTNLGTSKTLFALSLPTGIQLQPIFRATGAGASAGGVILTSPSDESDVAPGTFASTNAWTVNPGYDIATGSSSPYPIIGSNQLLTNTSAQIGARATTTSIGLTWVTRGWIDFRRN